LRGPLRIDGTVMQRLAGWLERFADLTGRGIAWLTAGMVLVTFAVVVLRYVFDWGSIAMQESVTYMHALVFMLGAAYTLRQDGHVRVDIFYRKLGPRGQAWVNLLGVLLLLFPVCLYIARDSWEYVATSWAVLEGSREAGGLPGVFLLKTLQLIMPVLLMLQGLADALRALLLLRGETGTAA
jgi:TRAP-type mannitol/chloroaromatic compound transport system permease small subunit